MSVRLPTVVAALGSVSLALASVPALAAPEPGSYSGQTTARVQNFRDERPRTDRGKVTFTVRARKARNFKVTGQQATCGGQTPEVDFKISSIALSSAGKGKATYNDRVLGRITVTITVTSRGTAKGTISFGGLCATKATFAAKER